MSGCSQNPENQPPNQSPPLGSCSFRQCLTEHPSGPGVVVALEHRVRAASPFYTRGV